jgi:hypothetical protein
MTGAALGLTVPTGARWAIITVEATAADVLRWTDDGVTVPTDGAAGVGMPIQIAANAFTAPIIFATDLTALKFIGLATSKLDISYYK